MINIIIIVKGIQEISDRLYIRVHMIDKFIISSDMYNRYEISGEMHVNDLSLIKFGVVSYNN